jgi:two-component system, OmpR family, response regulator
MDVLLIEDDEPLAVDLARAFRDNGWSVRWSPRGGDLAPALREGKHDLVVLDLALPDVDGLDALSQARESGSETPVLILTARDAVADRVRGLESGAEDYLVKPFALPELLARMRVLVRRAQPSHNDVLSLGPLRMERSAHVTTLDGVPIELSQREWEVLETLLTQSERVVSKDELVHARSTAENGDEVSPNAIEVYVFRLRAKLQSPAIRIRTVRGFGYMLERVR